MKRILCKLRHYNGKLVLFNNDRNWHGNLFYIVKDISEYSKNNVYTTDEYVYKEPSLRMIDQPNFHT